MDGHFDYEVYCTNRMNTIYHTAQNFGGVKFWRIDHFRVLAGKNVGEFIVAYISYCSESGIWLGKILANGILSPNPSKFSPTKIFCYTVTQNLQQKTLVDCCPKTFW